MKRSTLLLFLILTLPVFLLAQSTTWPVKGVAKNGKEFQVNVYLEDGTSIPLIAIYEAGNDHFMDVKGVHNGKSISIKLIVTNDVLVPVKGVTENGEILKVKAQKDDGKILDVKGVSRDGNTMNIAAIDPDGRYYPLKAISPNGVERDIKGVKFSAANVEMEVGGVQIIGHVKALPTIDVGMVNSKWEVSSMKEDGTKLKLVAISKKGREHAVNAKMSGEFPYMMNVRGESSVDIYIKLFKRLEGVVLSGVDEFGREYDVRAVSESGDSYTVVGGERMGNVIPINVVGDEGKAYPLKAISSKGHEFDVKGLKIKKEDVEGIISDVDNAPKRFYAHVKALAPADLKEE